MQTAPDRSNVFHAFLNLQGFTLPKDGNRHEKSLKPWEKLTIFDRCLSGALSVRPICLNALELWLRYCVDKYL